MAGWELLALTVKTGVDLCQSCEDIDGFMKDNAAKFRFLEHDRPDLWADMKEHTIHRRRDLARQGKLKAAE